MRGQGDLKFDHTHFVQFACFPKVPRPSSFNGEIKEIDSK